MNEQLTNCQIGHVHIGTNNDMYQPMRASWCIGNRDIDQSNIRDDQRECMCESNMRSVYAILAASFLCAPCDFCYDGLRPYMMDGELRLYMDYTNYLSTGEWYIPLITKRNHLVHLLYLLLPKSAENDLDLFSFVALTKYHKILC